MDPKLKDISLLGIFDDGKFRQILLKKETKEAILSLLVIAENEISVLETPIESLSL